MRIEAKQTYLPDGHAYGKIVSLGNVAYQLGLFFNREVFKQVFIKLTLSVVLYKSHNGFNKRGFTTAVIAYNSIKLSCIKVKAYVTSLLGAPLLIILLIRANKKEGL